MKPADDETFFIFVVVADDPDTPTWEIRHSFIGAYEQTAALVVGYLGQLADQGRLGGGVRVQLYSAAGARNYLAAAGKEEMRYQRERRGQPNN